MYFKLHSYRIKKQCEELVSFTPTVIILAQKTKRCSKSLKVGEKECRTVSYSSSAPSPRSGLIWSVFCGVSTMLHAQHPTRCHHGKCSAKSSWEKCCSEGLRSSCDSLGARRVSKSATCICSMCSMCTPKHQVPRTLEKLALLGDILAPKESSRKLPPISFRARIWPGWRMHISLERPW